MLAAENQATEVLNVLDQGIGKFGPVNALQVYAMDLELGVETRHPRWRGCRQSSIMPIARSAGSFAAEAFSLQREMQSKHGNPTKRPWPRFDGYRQSCNGILLRLS
jgi:hypothetical protein